MAYTGNMFTGKSNGRYDAVRISPTNAHFVQVRYENGQWFDEWGTGGWNIDHLVWENQWVDAVAADGTRRLR